jgi:hypothetical protein
MASHDSAVSNALHFARKDCKPKVIHKARNGQWMFCSSAYWFENRDRLKDAHVIYPNGDSHALHPQDMEPL